MEWLKLTLRSTSDHLDRLTTELLSLGSVGTQELAAGSRVHVSAYFETSKALPTPVKSPGDDYWTDLGAALESVEIVGEVDWTERHRRLARPFALGRTFVVDPSEPDGEGEGLERDRRLLRLPARQAFGTGSHESTRLVVEWLEDLELSGLRVLDVGTGTGILSFAALHLGAARAVGVEVDPTAVAMAAWNQRLNETSFPLVAGRVDALGDQAGFDLALINVLPQNVERDLARVYSALVPSGRALFSGILSRFSEEVCGRLESAGLVVVDRREVGEWEAVMTKREAR